MANRYLIGVIGCLLANTSHANCWQDVSSRYKIPVPLLKCIVKKESAGDPHAIRKNKDDSQDIGFAQINDWWLPRLAKYDIRYEDLFNACTNLHVGAWILASNFKDYGYTWRAIGVYNAGTKNDSETEARRIHYANKIFQCLNEDA